MGCGECVEDFYIWGFGWGFALSFIQNWIKIYERVCITLVAFAAVTRVTLSKETIAEFLLPAKSRKQASTHLGVFSGMYVYFFHKLE